MYMYTCLCILVNNRYLLNWTCMHVHACLCTCICTCTCICSYARVGVKHVFIFICMYWLRVTAFWICLVRSGPAAQEGEQQHGNLKPAHMTGEQRVLLIHARPSSETSTVTFSSVLATPHAVRWRGTAPQRPRQRLARRRAQQIPPRPAAQAAGERRFQALPASARPPDCSQVFPRTLATVLCSPTAKSDTTATVTATRPVTCRFPKVSVFSSSFWLLVIICITLIIISCVHVYRVE